MALPSLYVFQLRLFVYNTRGDYVSNKDIHPINTRQKINFHLPFTKYTGVQRSLVVFGQKLYNYLPAQMKSCENFNRFKRLLKHFFVEKDRYKMSDAVF